MSEIQKFADAAMFKAAPMRQKGISVHLLWMTPDPLGAIAAACRMYEGYPTYDLGRDITDDDRRRYWEQVEKTHLKAPLEFVKLHFFIEGVDRAFTHQMVRQRTAVYAQESMRFAVKDNMVEETPLPPSLSGLKDDDPRVVIWNRTIQNIQDGYDQLVGAGVPAEDARGLLPHATTTRLNYATDLRALLDHAGNRLCTQAQFHWRVVFAGIAKAIAGHDPHPMDYYAAPDDRWQFETIANIFRPVCYQMGKCPFKADFDRGCTIRERVDANAEIGRASSEWGQDFYSDEGHPDATSKRPDIKAIHPEEWLLDPAAAHVKVGDKYGDQSGRS